METLRNLQGSVEVPITTATYSTRRGDGLSDDDARMNEVLEPIRIVNDVLNNEQLGNSKYVDLLRRIWKNTPIFVIVLICVIIIYGGRYILNMQADAPVSFDKANISRSYLYADTVEENELENLTKIVNMRDQYNVSDNICVQYRDLIWPHAHPLSYRKKIELQKDCKKMYYLGKAYFIFVCQRSNSKDAFVRFSQYYTDSKGNFEEGDQYIDLTWDQFCSLAFLVETILYDFEKLNFLVS